MISGPSESTKIEGGDVVERVPILLAADRVEVREHGVERAEEVSGKQHLVVGQPDDEGVFTFPAISGAQ